MFSYGREATRMLDGKGCEIFQLFTEPWLVDEPLLIGFLRWLRGSVAESRRCWRPKRLVLTTSPELLQSLRPLLEASGRQAGFAEVALLDEYQCLEKAVNIEGATPTIVADVGASGTRVYAWHNGHYIANALTVIEAGGHSLRAAIVAHCASARDLAISSRTAEDLLKRAGDAILWPHVFRVRDCTTGMPVSAAMEHPELVASIRPVLDSIANTCSDTAVRLAAVVTATPRVILTGGGAETFGLREIIEQKLSATVEAVSTPAEASARGLVELLRR
jgi:actin-like ATPase involved in cell morphogenesis